MQVLNDWSFLTNHARALLLVARDPDSRLREISAALGVTERTAHTIMGDLVAAGYVAKERSGRNNIYQIQHHLPLHDPLPRRTAVGELLGLFIDEEELKRSESG